MENKPSEFWTGTLRPDSSGEGGYIFAAEKDLPGDYVEVIEHRAYAEAVARAERAEAEVIKFKAFWVIKNDKLAGVEAERDKALEKVLEFRRSMSANGQRKAEEIAELERECHEWKRRHEHLALGCDTMMNRIAKLEKELVMMTDARNFLQTRASVCEEGLDLKYKYLVGVLEEIHRTVDDDGMGGWLTDLVGEALRKVRE